MVRPSTLKAKRFKTDRRPFLEVVGGVENHLVLRVLHALRLLPTDGLLCLFLKTTFAEGKERYQRIFGVTPPALVLQCSERVLCAKNADFDGMIAGGGSAVSYAWWVWRKGWSGQTTLDWINHPSAQQAVQLELFM